MTTKYDKNEIIQLHKKFDEENENGKRAQLDKLWASIKRSALLGNNSTSYCIGRPPYSLKTGDENTDTHKLFVFLNKELQNIGNFTCETKRSHIFQCDCDDELGCGEFIVVTWDPDTL